MAKLQIFTDGASRGNPGLAGAGVFVCYEDGKSLLEQAIFLGVKTNNEAEYLAFLASVIWLNKKQTVFKIDEVVWYLDSKLIVEQINRNWQIKESRLQELAKRCWQELVALPYQYSIKHIPREQNKQADGLANLAMDLAQSLPIRL